MSQKKLLISIVINNYNYDRFLGAAINSALSQTYPFVEVIVVDDGSSDNSPNIIKQYGERIKSCIKTNGGQGSAFNAGFKMCSGDIVVFLDSDDLLHQETAGKVAEAFRADPSLAKVQYRLQKIDTDGNILEGADAYDWLSGDYRKQTISLQHYWWPPTSANAFAARFLRDVFPVPEDTFRICADYYVNNMILLCGNVISLAFTGVSYRIHQTNNYYEQTKSSSLNLPAIRRHLLFCDAINRKQREYIVKYLPQLVDSIGNYDISALRAEITVKRLDNQDKIIKRSGWQICVSGLKASLRNHRLNTIGKMFSIAWFILMFSFPKMIARYLAYLYYNKSYVLSCKLKLGI